MKEKRCKDVECIIKNKIVQNKRQLIKQIDFQPNKWYNFGEEEFE